MLNLVDIKPPVLPLRAGMLQVGMPLQVGMQPQAGIRALLGTPLLDTLNLADIKPWELPPQADMLQAVLLLLLDTPNLVDIKPPILRGLLLRVGMLQAGMRPQAGMQALVGTLVQSELLVLLLLLDTLSLADIKLPIFKPPELPLRAGMLNQADINLRISRLLVLQLLVEFKLPA